MINIFKTKFEQVILFIISTTYEGHYLYFEPNNEKTGI